LQEKYQYIVWSAADNLKRLASYGFLPDSDGGRQRDSEQHALADSVPAQTFVNEICNATNGQENKWTDDRVHVHIQHLVLADGICLPRQDQMLMK
jgi:hypothetical protein